MDDFLPNPVGIPAIWDAVVGVAPGWRCPGGASRPSRALSDERGSLVNLTLTLGEMYLGCEAVLEATSLLWDMWMCST